jgi:hypothetical protein
MMFTLGQPPSPVDELAKEYTKNLAVHAPQKVGPAVASLGITNQDDLIEIFKLLVTHDANAASRHIQNSGIQDQSALAEIAMTAASRDGVGTSRRIENYGITDPLTRGRIAAIAFTKDRATLDELHHYNLPEAIELSEVFKPFFDELTSGAHRSSDFYWLRDFLRRTMNHPSLCDALGIESHRFSALAPHERLARVATWLQSRYDGFTDELFSYQHEVLAEEAICDALAATIVYWRTADVARYGNRARASLAALTGYDSMPSEQMSSNSLRELYGVLLTAYHMIGPDLAKIVPVDLSDTPRALKILSLATAIKGLRYSLPEHSGTISTPEQYDEAERNYTQFACNALQTNLRIKVPVGLSSATKSIEHLWDYWGGDLTPLIVLAGRCNAHYDWQTALPFLREIAVRCLGGSFYNWRYRRHDNQLAMLNDQQLQSWRNNPTRIALYTTDAVHQADAYRSIVEQAKIIFNTRIYRHLPASIAEAVDNAPLEQTRVESLLNLEEREFSRLPLADAMKLLQRTVESQNYAHISLAAKRINGAKERLLNRIDKGHRAELSEDFKALHNLTKRSAATQGSQYYVVSVITDHPKLLLMLGDLVQVGSCQNYRSGSHINTLPDYAIDGNVKLALSYVVKASVYDQIVDTGANVVFDPATQNLVIQGREARLKLGYALRREVLRVGTYGKHEAVCVIEQPDSQNHVLSDAILSQQREFITDYLNECDIRLETERYLVSFPATRREIKKDRRTEKIRTARLYGCK